MTTLKEFRLQLTFLCRIGGTSRLRVPIWLAQRKSTPTVKLMARTLVLLIARSIWDHLGNDLHNKLVFSQIKKVIRMRRGLIASKDVCRQGWGLKVQKMGRTGIFYRVVTRKWAQRLPLGKNSFWLWVGR